ncbi:MAG TPA: ribosome silencing factor, partial [Cytophagaceae bacterium]|nr:ribosome silencing factor [Cytophagaceae bacterium]
NTDTQVDAIRNSIEEEVWKASQQEVWMKEGMQNKEWILLDYADVVAHIFRTDRREFYGLEDLWGDAEITVLDDDTAQATKRPPKEVKIKTLVKEKKAKTKPNVTVAKKSTATKKKKSSK